MALSQLLLSYLHDFFLFLYHVYLSNRLACLPEFQIHNNIFFFSTDDCQHQQAFICQTFTRPEGLVDGQGYWGMNYVTVDRAAAQILED